MPGVIGFDPDIVSPTLFIEEERDSIQTIKEKALNDCSTHLKIRAITFSLGYRVGLSAKLS